ncbi:MAG: glycosyltransferase family 9 protein [Betaproteobacteria bacterium]
MADSRGPMRVASVVLALARWGLVRRKPANVRRILVLHHLLLGDTLMLTALLAKLRTVYPVADIVMTLSRAYASLYASTPFGVEVAVLDPRDFSTFRSLLRLPRFDLVILPADNRWSWLARAIGARWIVGLAGDRPVHKNWPVDELIPYSAAPTAFCETAAALVDGPQPAPYRVAEWPAPPVVTVPEFGNNVALLHVGASSVLKRWPPERWRALAEWLETRGMRVVWSAGPGESAIVDAIDAGSSRAKILGTLSLDALWHVLCRSRLLVCPDTGIAHLGRLVGVPTVTLFGPGSALICGPGAFFTDMPGRAVTVDPFPCRDQTIQFFREVPWARRCERLYGTSPGQCPRAKCMEAIDLEAVRTAIESLRVLP